MHKNIIKIRKEFKNGNFNIELDKDLILKDFESIEDLKDLDSNDIYERFDHFLQAHELLTCVINGYLYLEDTFLNKLYLVYSSDNILMKFEDLIRGKIKILKLESVQSKRMIKSLYEDMSNGY